MTSPTDDGAVVHEDRLWADKGWTARVIKNEDDDGWAVAMYKQGVDEPALVGPWTMGRDKKNPKPLDAGAFNTLVKTASEVLRRHEQHLQATLHQEITVSAGGGRISVRLDITPDDDQPSARLTAVDDSGEELAAVAVSPGFRLNRASAEAWIASDYARPR
ncbi:hypothetical protein KAK07_11665 [Ideonella sp. 4Y16]|uniref:hypothetical protein n=1 Tax=Ideonella alba TaxID=2824118 RepID=UPI001B38CFEA|nr:hypothetical protein [Ideonella alba]MBQ0943993.1 hypothetical protein [Ideonella alba]